ncbi:MAG: hypothetical protein AAF518_24755 [Spirochaetota bacterium]
MKNVNNALLLAILSLLVNCTNIFPFQRTKIDESSLWDQTLFLLVSIPSNPQSRSFEQYTPDQANWDTFYTKTTGSHEPNSVSWLSAEDWAKYQWDGTVYNPSKMTRKEFVEAICPHVDGVRGIHELFYRVKPFANVNHPTRAEVDEWHRVVINHIRALIGYTSEEYQIQKNHCMFARALWGQERKFTTKWDAKYPGKHGSAYGPCQGSDNSHCGATFIPDPEDQVAYLPEGHASCVRQQGSEGIFGGPKSHHNWSIKWSRGLCNTLHAEGFWGGHVGPWFHRKEFGFSFWDSEPGNNNSHTALRAKWTGTRLPNLYCNPSDSDCDPNNTGPNSNQ